jgi:hypothetical protein
MDEGHSRRPAGSQRARRSASERFLEGRPDRLALWAVFMAVFAALVAAASSAGAS